MRNGQLAVVNETIDSILHQTSIDKWKYAKIRNKLKYIMQP